ncbi:MAG TPA: thiamine phosphate synthase [Polyangiaceae bacterium]|nr:thiamine phosphate synthase [Polyangiaceae bacterium]
MRGLYAIVDVGTLRGRLVEPVAFAAAVLAVRPAALQLRAKELPSRETLAMLRELAPMCHRAGVLLVANDRPDLAVMAGCDLVHVGQSDIPIDRARRLAPGLAVGVSTHDPEQLQAALEARPVYVAYGPVFETTTKKDPAPVVGVAGLRAAYARAAAARIPLVAIGGITRERAAGLVGLADAVAVVADLLPPPSPGRSVGDLLVEVTARARAIHALFAPAAAAVGAAR